MDLKLPKWGQIPYIKYVYNIKNIYIYYIILLYNQPVCILFGPFLGFSISCLLIWAPHLHGSVVTPTVPPGPEGEMHGCGGWRDPSHIKKRGVTR